MTDIQMPELTGSEKEIAWAQKIRSAFVQFYGQSRPEMVGRDVAAHTDAHYWIFHRWGMGTTNADQREIEKLWK